MDPWTIGLIAVIILGLAVIAFGALSDRAKNKRAAVEMLAPPRRDIPHFKPDSPAPHYLSDLQARRAAVDVRPTDLTPAERAEVTAQLKRPSTTTVNAGYLSRDFITDPTSSWAVLDSPRVLVCADPVESTRELLTILEKLVLSQTPLVIVAPALAPDVQATLEVNAIRRTLRLVAVATRARPELERAAQATAAEIRDRSDLQAGYVRPEHLGSCERWVSTAKNSYVINPATTPATGDAT